ncbi:MAG TPA: hypothetical protein VF605_00520 [Allosphingosinicella sp.]|jgi:hypothetical protein
MKVNPQDFMGPKAEKTLKIPTFGVTSKAKGTTKSAASRITAHNVDSLERLLAEADDRQRSLAKGKP